MFVVFVAFAVVVVVVVVVVRVAHLDRRVARPRRRADVAARVRALAARLDVAQQRQEEGQLVGVLLLTVL